MSFLEIDKANSSQNQIKPGGWLVGDDQKITNAVLLPLLQNSMGEFVGAMAISELDRGSSSPPTGRD